LIKIYICKNDYYAELLQEYSSKIYKKKYSQAAKLRLLMRG